MKAYSEDLRQKIVKATERGVSKAQAARLFGVSLSSVKRYARGWLAEEALSLRARAQADLRRSTRARRGFSKRTSKIARPPPSRRGASRGASFWSASPARA